MAADQTIFFFMAAVVAFLIGLSKGGLGGMLGALADPMERCPITGMPNYLTFRS
jgi:hypothetical protein